MIIFSKVQLNIILHKKLYSRKQTGKISTSSYGPFAIFKGAITPYKDIRLEIHRYRHIWLQFRAYIRPQHFFVSAPLINLEESGYVRDIRYIQDNSKKP